MLGQPGISRNLTDNSYRMSSPPWILETGDPSTDIEFYAGRRSTGELVMVKPVLAIGSIVHRKDQSDRFFVSQCTYFSDHEVYTLLKVSQVADVSRFSAEGSRDSFGRVSADLPTIVYSSMPLYLYPLDRPKPDDKPDRLSEAISYKFLTSDSYSLVPRDQLTVGTQSLVITAVLLAPDGLTEFLAEETT